jgi:hypothetical protein
LRLVSAPKPLEEANSILLYEIICQKRRKTPDNPTVNLLAPVFSGY